MAANLVTDPGYPGNPTRALTNCFLSTDNGFLELARSHRPPLDDGTTAVLALVVGDQIWVANGTVDALRAAESLWCRGQSH
jgi:hypothetical protein